MAARIHLFVILALALLCSGCSIVSVGYNNADWYLRYKINNYTSFNAQQKEEIRREVDDYMRWHRKNALPEYIRFLQDLQDVVQRGRHVQADDIARLKGESYELYRKTLGPFIPPAARLLNSLDKRQIEELNESLTEMNREQRDESLNGSLQANLEKRAERTIDFVEELVGNLRGEQEDKIREMSLQLPFATGYYIDHREANRAALIALLNSHAGENNISAFLWLWLNAPEVTRTPQQQHVIQSYDDAIDEMTARIYQLLTDHQKDHLRNKILSYIEEFQRLSAKSSTVSDTPG